MASSQSDGFQEHVTKSTEIDVTVAADDEMQQSSDTKDPIFEALESLLIPSEVDDETLTELRAITMGMDAVAAEHVLKHIDSAWDSYLASLPAFARSKASTLKLTWFSKSCVEVMHSFLCLPFVACKRPLHASFPSHSPSHIDRLQGLYPHVRDKDCYLDEKDHKYFVHGEPYGLSVSGWWKRYFEEFDAQGVSESIVRRHLQSPGFRMNASGEISQSSLFSTVYNFAQYVRVFQKQSDNDFFTALRAASILAQEDYACRNSCSPFSVEQILDAGRWVLMDLRKPQGASCYYLVLLCTSRCSLEVQARQIAETWNLYGRLESLKGTYLHKKIELFINAMVIPMEKGGSLCVPVEELLRETPPTQEYSAQTVMSHIAWGQDAEIWNHPLAQSFFEGEMLRESLEFRKFRAWLATKQHWTPLRVEWSIYNEDLKVAGQIDSLWLDIENGGEYVIVDWKRVRQLLTSDPVELEHGSFGRMGKSCCSHLYDTAWSNYLVQQTLYAYLLASKYGRLVRRMMLVQCHSHVRGLDFHEAALVPDYELAQTMAKALAC